MGKLPRLLLVLAVALGPATARASCSGSIVGSSIPVATVVEQARIVYIGEVIGLRLLTKRPRHNSRALYEVTFRSITTLKGRSPVTQRGTYRNTYWESPPASSMEDDVSEIMVTDGVRSFEFGRKYLMLLQKPNALGEIGVCDNRVVGLGPAVLRGLRELPGIAPLVPESPPHD